MIKVFDLSRTPWDLRCPDYSDLSLHPLQLINSFIDILIFYLSVKVSKKVNCALMINHLWWPRLYSREVDPIFCENIQGLLQDTWFVIQCQGDRGPIFYLPISFIVSSMV